MNEAVVHDVAVMLVRRYLAGLRGWPARPEGETRLAKTVQESCISVSHAEAVLETFNDLCPTPREISETAHNLRPKFAPPEPSPVEKWKAEGCTYDQGYFERISKEVMSGPGAKTQHERMWEGIRAKLKVRDFAHVPWGQCWQAAHELGFPLNHYQEEERLQWLAGQPRREAPEEPPKRAITGKSITWEDVQAAQRAREQAKQHIQEIDDGYREPDEDEPTGA